MTTSAKKFKLMSTIFIVLIAFLSPQVWGQNPNRSLGGTSIHPSSISQGEYHGLGPALRDIEPLSEAEALKVCMRKKEKIRKENDDKTRHYPNASKALPKGDDPVWQDFDGSLQNARSEISSFDGGWTASYPPDANGDIGKDYYFQTINLTYQIFDKLGNSVVGPYELNSLFGSVPGTNCNSGDPIVLYDDQAERWLVAEFSVCDPTNYRMLVAVSQSADPTGRWHQYSFAMNGFPDYEKIGVWHDGYYMATNTLVGDEIHVMERDKMLLGQSPQCISFDNPWRPNGNGFMMTPPVDNDGVFAPSSEPGIFIAFNDDAWTGSDQLWMFELDTDWATPANSSFSRTQQINVAAFNSNFGSSNANILQPGNDSQVHYLDAVCEVIMNKPQYRNFGSYQSIVCCHTVNVGVNNHAGIRWYELRNTGSGWGIRQQGTYAPDSHSRWLGSISMNANHEIALGYSVSSSSLYPGIRYCGQSATENVAASGSFDIAETVLYSGGESQIGITRWGDYASMSIDPKNDETFWFTTEYLNGYRHTKVAAFQLGAEALFADFYAEPRTGRTNATFELTDLSTGSPTSWSWSFSPSSGISYLDGTTSSSQNPKISFANSGIYEVSLVISKGAENDTLTRTAYLNVLDCKISNFPYYEDFEQHSGLPICLSEENVSGILSWEHKKGNNGSNPVYAHEGSFNALFQKEYNEAGGVRKLVLPEFDFSAQSSAYLNFWHCQEDWLGDQDILKVYYKTSSTGSWTLLHSYESNLSNWQQESIPLPNLSSAYFVALEGHALGGYGICIDDISVIGSSGGSAPVADFSASSLVGTTKDTLSFYDQSENFPVSWSWAFSPSTVSYQNGTSSASQNPHVKFNATGQYTVSLTATNPSGNDTESKSTYINIVDIFNLPWQDNFESDKGWALSGEFERATPMAKGGSNGNADPGAAPSGTKILGVDLSGLGTYQGDYEPSLAAAAYTAESPLFDCSSYQEVFIKFKRWLNIESSWYDVAKIEGSTNEGASWSELWTNAVGNTTESSWSEVTHDVSWQAALESKFKIRFTIGSTDSDIQYSGWNIDDFEIYGTMNYCFAMGMPDNGYIKEVNVGSIHKSSSSDGYSIYSNVSTTLFQGQRDIEISIVNGKSDTEDDLGAWVDWNLDGDFNDVGENIICSVNSGGQGTFLFDVPTGASIGSAILRIRIKNAGDDCGSPCGDTPKGEVEDYRINVIAPSSCPPPFLENPQYVMGGSVQLHWTENGSASLWDIELREGTATFTGNPTESNASTTAFTYSGLSPNTWYKYYVRSSCGSGDYSNWEGPAEFTTSFNANTVYPYQESFEVNNPPNGWGIEVLSGDDWNAYWYSYTNTYPTGGGVPDGSYLVYFNGASLNETTTGRYSTMWYNLGSMSNTVLSFMMYHENGNPDKNQEGIKLQTSLDGDNWTDIGPVEPRYSKGSGWSKHTADLSAYDGQTIKVGFLFSSETGKNIHIDDVRIHNSAPTTAEWTGSSNGNWYDANNWSSTDIPYPTTEVSIPASATNFPTIEKVGARCKSLSIKSIANKDASLIENGYLQVENSAYVQRYISSGKWSGLASPLSGATAEDVYFNGSPEVWLSGYDESSFQYYYISDLNQALGDMKGWYYWIDQDSSAQTLNIDGDLRSGTIGSNSNLIRSGAGEDYGWNLVGNPFTSAINWDAVSGWTKSNVNPTIYVYKSNGWSSYNSNTGIGNNGGSKYLAMGQSFFVEVTDNSGAYPETGSLKMSPEVQVHNEVSYQKETTFMDNFLKIAVQSDGQESETSILTYPEASQHFDPQLDAHFLQDLDGGTAQLFTQVDGDKLSINALPRDCKEVDLGLSCPDGVEATIEISDVKNFANVFLIDLSNGIETDLLSENYSFIYSSANDEGFKLLFDCIAGTTDPEPSNFVVYSVGKTVFIVTPEDVGASFIEIYNLFGQRLNHLSAKPGLNKVRLKTTGYYLVKIYNNNRFFSKKVFIN
jgi:PKD repeat protein